MTPSDQRTEPVYVIDLRDLNEEESLLASVPARLLDPEPAVRMAAIEAVETTGDERALLLLLDAIQDPVDDVRHAAGDALRRHRSDELVAAIRSELSVPARAQAADAALAVLGEPRMGRTVEPPPDELPALVEMLRDPRPERRRVACERLGFRRARSAVDPLLERLTDPERGVRIKAADALAMIGDPEAVRALRRYAATDPDRGVALAMERAARVLAGER